jgi:hypothetical protein
MTKDEICGLLRQIHDVLAMQSETNQVKPVAEQEPVAHQKWCASLTQLLLSMPPQPAPCNCHPPQRTEPVCPECKAGVLYECVACSSNNYPPQRPWVGLTDDQVNEIYTSVEVEVNEHWNKGGTTKMFPLTLYKAIEAKLRSKNT